MPIKDVETPFPVIDKDPHFFRVVRYFRTSDYAALAAGTAAAPAIMLGFARYPEKKQYRLQVFLQKATANIMQYHVLWDPVRSATDSNNGVHTPMTRNNPYANPSYTRNVSTKAMRGPLRLAGFIGAVGGFLIAYQRSSLRFWGWEENAAEVEKDKAEMAQRVAEGKPLYGESQLSPYLQSVAAGNSRNAQLKFSKLPSFLPDTLLLYRVFNSLIQFPDAIPWFNFANHDQHGVDAAKYNETQ
ncbi:hypothetical protein INT44_004453 [Umbelopsis vinacea]|uniref:Uncharacterized protein n=1 Tax=Umbelopsis vinacea TaxID=44442 RepID=A0A8H7QBF8_9FUNG|nr:hypothetical protein INT44_004453 [Umbelopsis vinacea]